MWQSYRPPEPWVRDMPDTTRHDTDKIDSSIRHIRLPFLEKFTVNQTATDTLKVTERHFSRLNISEAATNINKLKLLKASEGTLSKHYEMSDLDGSCNGFHSRCSSAENRTISDASLATSGGHGIMRHRFSCIASVALRNMHCLMHCLMLLYSAIQCHIPISM